MKRRAAAALAALVPIGGCTHFEPLSIVNPYVANTLVGGVTKDGAVTTSQGALSELVKARADAQYTANRYLGAVRTAAYTKNVGLAALTYFVGDAVYLRAIKGSKPSNRNVTGTAVAAGAAYTLSAGLLPNVRTTIYFNGISAVNCAIGQSTPYLVDDKDYAAYLDTIPAYGASRNAQSVADTQTKAREQLTVVEKAIADTSRPTSDQAVLKAAQRHLQEAISAGDAALGDAQSIPGKLQEVRSRISAAGPALRDNVRQIELAVNEQLANLELSATDMRALLTGFSPLNLGARPSAGPTAGAAAPTAPPGTKSQNYNLEIEALKPKAAEIAAAADTAARDLASASRALAAETAGAKAFLKVVAERQQAAQGGACDVAQAMVFLVTPLGQARLKPGDKFAILVLAPSKPQVQVDGGDDIAATVVMTEAPRPGASGHYQVDLAATDKLDQTTAQRHVTITSGTNTETVVIDTPKPTS